MLYNITELNPVDFDEANQELVIIDQTILPERLEHIKLRNIEEVHNAIYLLQVRGAPAIAVAAAFGLYIATLKLPDDNENLFFDGLKKAVEYLASARPTAVNLFWALDRMEKKALSLKDCPIGEVKKALLNEAKAIRSEDMEVCRVIGENALSLLSPNMGILTHCNAGQLATIRYGTALAPLYLGQERGYNFRIYIDETRPLLQGARLTAFEMANIGADATLICDNMAATVMQKGLVDVVLVGADRIARNGDTANKVGTLGLSILAEMFNIPFYIVAPVSTIDLLTPSGEEIVVEERPGTEVTEMWYKKPMAPDGIKVFNPAFDVTANELITGIITERGIVKPPYIDNFRKLFNF